MKHTLPVTDIEAFLLDTKIRMKGHLHDIGAGVECESVGCQATKLNAARASVDNDAVIDAALCLLELEVKESELQDKAGRSLQCPCTCLSRRVVVWVARRRKDSTGCCEHFITLALAAQHFWTKITAAYIIQTQLIGDEGQRADRGR